MKIHQQSQGAVTVLSPKGPLIGDDADEFRARMLEALRETRGRAVLDASGIPMVDSRALEALVEVNQELASTGRALKLCGANETLRHVLELTELAPLFEHFADANAAARSFL